MHCFEDNRLKVSGSEQLALSHKTLPALPGLTARLLIGVLRVWRFAGAHEAVPRAIVRHWLEGLPRGLHVGDRVGNHRADARVIPSKESIHRSFDALHRILIWWRPIKNERRGQISTIRRKAERLPTPPAESAHEQLSIRSRQLLSIVCNCV